MMKTLFGFEIDLGSVGGEDRIMLRSGDTLIQAMTRKEAEEHLRQAEEVCERLRNLIPHMDESP